MRRMMALAHGGQVAWPGLLVTKTWQPGADDPSAIIPCGMWSQVKVSGVGQQQLLLSEAHTFLMLWFITVESILFHISIWVTILVKVTSIMLDYNEKDS